MSLSSFITRAPAELQNPAFVPAKQPPGNPTETPPSVTPVKYEAQDGPSRADEVENLLSYGILDWCVTEEEERKALDLLSNDPNINQTISDLKDRGFLIEIFERIDDNNKRRTLLDAIAPKLSEDNANAIRDRLRTVDFNESGKVRPGGPPIDAGQTKTPSWELHFNFARNGVKADFDPSKFNRANYADLVSGDPAGGFTGSGATGVNPTDRDIPLGDLWDMGYHDVFGGESKVQEKYENPLRTDPLYNQYLEYDQRAENLKYYFGSKPYLKNVNPLDKEAVKTAVTNEYLRREREDFVRFGGTLPADGSLPPANMQHATDGTNEELQRISKLSVSPQDELNRSRQAELLFNAPVSTSMPELYGDKLPTRASIIKLAAEKYQLEPEVVAAFILAEQRDQSSNEDAADFNAVLLAGHDSSIGLGQVTVSTAMANDGELLSDSLSLQTRKNLTKSETAKFLADDVVNIFAVAAKIRQLANQGANLAQQAGGTKELAQQNDRRLTNIIALGTGGYHDAKLDGTATFVWQNLDLLELSQHSSTWSRRSIAMLGSEYTRTPWDSPTAQKSWGGLVLNSYTDIRQSEIFGKPQPLQADPEPTE